MIIRDILVNSGLKKNIHCVPSSEPSRLDETVHMRGHNILFH